MNNSSHRDIRYLAGNAFTGGRIALILCCILKGLQYQPEPDDEDDEEDEMETLMKQTVRAFTDNWAD